MIPQTSKTNIHHKQLPFSFLINPHTTLITSNYRIIVPLFIYQIKPIAHTQDKPDVIRMIHPALSLSLLFVRITSCFHHYSSKNISPLSFPIFRALCIHPLIRRRWRRPQDGLFLYAPAPFPFYYIKASSKPNFQRTIKKFASSTECLLIIYKTSCAFSHHRFALFRNKVQPKTVYLWIIYTLL